MDDQRTDRAGSGMLTLKRIVSWIVVAATATTLATYWHFLVFHSLDPDPPVYWVYSAFVALAITIAYMLIFLVESLASQKWRFSLRALLAAMTLVAVVLGAVIYGMNK
jgi:hypothetical protein